MLSGLSDVRVGQGGRGVSREVRPGGLLSISQSSWGAPRRGGEPLIGAERALAASGRQTWFGITNEATLTVVVLDEDDLALAPGHHADCCTTTGVDATAPTCCPSVRSRTARTCQTI